MGASNAKICCTGIKQPKRFPNNRVAPISKKPLEQDMQIGIYF